MKKRVRPIISIGTSCILLIFLSLCLLTFAVLSLASARADLRLSKKIADRTVSYYEGEAAASLLLADLDQELSSRTPPLETQSEVLSAMTGFFSNQTVAFSTWDTSVSLTVPYAEDQQLSIVLTAEDPSAAFGSFFNINAWKTESTRTWSPDTRQNVYQPELDAIPWED